MDKTQVFLDLIMPHFGKRHESEKAEMEWLRAWDRALKNFDPWVLEATANRLIDTREERVFPTVAEVRKVCYSVLADEKRSKPELQVHQGPKHDPFALADALIACNLGRQAARDNPSWIVPLHDFCREQGRLPDSGEIGRLKRIAHDGEQIEHAIAIGKVAPTPTVKRGREILRERREKLRRRLLGDGADAPAESTFKPDNDWMDRERALYRSRMSEPHRLASEWMDKICAEYGSFENWHKAKRPPGSHLQNKPTQGGEA